MRPLEEIERDLAALPPGPWTIDHHSTKLSHLDSPWTEIHDANDRCVVDTSNSGHPFESPDYDVYLDTGRHVCERIARLRSDTPDLVAEVLRLRGVIADVHTRIGGIPVATEITAMGVSLKEDYKTINRVLDILSSALGAQS